MGKLVEVILEIDADMKKYIADQSGILANDSAGSVEA